MKASELIAALQPLIAEHGDRDVHVYDDGVWTEPQPAVISEKAAACPRDWGSVPPGDFGL